MRHTYPPHRVRRAGALAILVLLIAGHGLAGCGIGSAIDRSVDKAVQVINTGIYEIDQNSAAWQSVLQQVADQLPQDIDQTIRVEAQTLADRTIARGGVEFRCNADFLGDRARQSLLRLKARLLEQTPAPVRPGFCQVAPDALDLKAPPASWSKIGLYGYDLDTLGSDGKLLSVLMISKEGKATPLPDYRVARTTHYQVTLNAGDLARQLYTDRIVKLVVSWDGRTDGLPEVAVIPWESQRKTILVPIGRTGPYMPPHVGGDRDFDTSDDEPTSLRVTGEIEVAPQKIVSRVCMHARELEPDHTEVKGCDAWQLSYSAPDGWKIVEALPRARFDLRMTVTTHETIAGHGSTGEVVERFEARIDRSGDEAGTWSSVTTYWQPLNITIEQAVPEWLQ